MKIRISLPSLQMAYRVYKGDGEICEYVTFRDAYDAYDHVRDFRLTFDGMEWVWKTKGAVWDRDTEDCLENLCEEYKNEWDDAVGYWVWFASEAPNHNDLVDMESRGLLTEIEREEMGDRACLIRVVNEQTFLNKFGYFDH
jgi:hypothetical protein